MSLLEIQNLTIAHQNTPLVKGISFTLEKGKTTCIIGESGSGKSLTALAIMDLLPPTLALQADKLPHPKRGTEAGMIFQEPLTALNPVIPIGKQIEEMFTLHTKLDSNQRKKEVLTLLGKVKLPNPETIIHAYPTQLSGGQRQRVMIAMALALKPKLLIADEPTTALDITTQTEILKLLKELQQEMGMAILFITHDFNVVETIADHVLVMHQGEIVEEGNFKAIFKKPKQVYTKKLIAATPKLTLNKKPKKVTEPLLEVQGLGHQFTAHSKSAFTLFPQKKTVLKDVSFTLHKGETIGIVGESGCGKSTLSKCILHLYTPTSGKVTIHGSSLEKKPNVLGGMKFLFSKKRGNVERIKTYVRPAKVEENEKFAQIRRLVQMVFQDPFSSLNPRMRVGDSIAEGLRAHKMLPEDEIRPYVEELLQQCQLPIDSFDRYPHHFSGGQRQRICIARALAMKPQVIIADEAVSALDVSIQREILALLQTLKEQYGLSYLFISHDLRVISEIADKVFVMYQGKIVEQGTVKEVFTKAKHPYTQQLVSSVTA